MFLSDLSLVPSSLPLTELPLWLKIVQFKMAFNNTDQLKSFQLIECLMQAVLSASNYPSPWQCPVDSARQWTVVGPCLPLPSPWPMCKLPFRLLSAEWQMISEHTGQHDSAKWEEMCTWPMFPSRKTRTRQIHVKWIEAALPAWLVLKRIGGTMKLPDTADIKRQCNSDPGSDLISLHYHGAVVCFSLSLVPVVQLVAAIMMTLFNKAAKAVWWLWDL